KDDVETGMAGGHLLERVEVHRRVLTNGRVRAAAGLHTDNPIGGERLASDEELHVLLGEDVVGDHAQPVAVAHRLAQAVDERRFSRADRAADSDSQWRLSRHDRKSLECTYCCVIAAMSSAGVNDSIRPSRRATSSTTTGTRARVRASSAWA